MKISVIIPAYNCADTIRASIESALQQSYSDIEILVIDDGSVDDTLMVVGAMTDARLRLIPHSVNQGAAAARNTGIREAQGEWIAFLDSDDTWLPEKLIRQLDFTINEGLLASTTRFSLKREGHDVVVPDSGPTRQTLEELVWGCYVSPGCTLLAKRCLYDDVGLQDTSYPRLEDWDWLLRFALAGNILGVMEEPLSCVHLSGSPSLSAVDTGLSLILDQHKDALNKLNIKLGKRLEAGVAIERAGQAFRDGRKLRAGLFILRSLWLCPFGNQAFQRVVKPRIF